MSDEQLYKTDNTDDVELGIEVHATQIVRTDEILDTPALPDSEVLGAVGGYSELPDLNIQLVSSDSDTDELETSKDTVKTPSFSLTNTLTRLINRGRSFTRSRKRSKSTDSAQTSKSWSPSRYHRSGTKYLKTNIKMPDTSTTTHQQDSDRNLVNPQNINQTPATPTLTMSSGGNATTSTSPSGQFLKVIQRQGIKVSPYSGHGCKNYPTGVLGFLDTMEIPD